MIKSNGYKVLNYSEFRDIIRSVASEIKSKSLGPIEIGNLGRRHWNALKEPIISDLKKRVVRKKKKARSKSAGPTPAKQPKQNPPAPADLQGGALGQPRAPAQAADQAPPVGPEGVDVANVGNPAAQPSVGQGDATGGPSQPIPTNQAPPLFPVGFPPTPGTNFQEMAQFGQHEAAPFGGRGFQRGHGRTRNRRNGGRKFHMSYPRGQRGGGNTNPGAPGLAAGPSRGNGGLGRGGQSQRYYSVWCGVCNILYPNWVGNCTHCYATLS